MAVAQIRSIGWLAAYPRSGVTWLRFLLANYFFEEEFDWRGGVNRCALELDYWWAELLRHAWTAQQLLARTAELPGRPASILPIPGVDFFKTHLPWSGEHPLASHTFKAIHLVRNPKDVLLSSLNYRHLCETDDFDEVEHIREFIAHGGCPEWIRWGYGSWEAHFQSWTAAPFPVLTVRYEDLRADTERELSRIVAFLGCAPDPAALERARERSSLATLRRLEVEARAQGRFNGLSEGRFFIHEGQSGQSLAALGSRLDIMFDRAFRKPMRRAGYVGARPAASRSRRTVPRRDAAPPHLP